ARLDFIPPGAFTNRMTPDVPSCGSFASVDPDDPRTLCLIPSQFADGSVKDPSKLVVALALFKPEYDESEQRWYADIRIAPDDNTYFPFVRLAMARYNPNAIP